MKNAARIARLDLTLLWRNRTGMFTVVGMPVMFAALLLRAGDDAVAQGAEILGMFLLFAVFSHLVSVFTARREDHSLKRLRGTSLSDAEILGGSVLAAAGMYAVQALALLAVMGIALGGGLPADPLLMLAGMAGGVAVFAVLAFVVSGLSPTAESTQLTVLPILFACLFGVMLPVDAMPGAVQEAVRWIPLAPVTEIIQTGYLGRDFTSAGDHAPLGFTEAWTACLRPFAVLLLWALAGRAAAARRFRWEPRHA
ncbi:ABC transporter permease [Spirillospora sp. NPDC029432]|uniref:ABC transporter permease n=1 Tax=Spirillospora sp. NPDC029432 TaxID=3154599 RepID=UPI0034545FC4